MIEHNKQVLYESNTCLKPQVTPWASRMLRLYKHYKNGILLDNGGVMRQPALYMRVMEFIEGYIG